MVKKLSLGCDKDELDGVFAGGANNGMCNSSSPQWEVRSSPGYDASHPCSLPRLSPVLKHPGRDNEPEYIHSYFLVKTSDRRV